MILLITKTILSALTIVAVSEISKRSGYLGGLLKALPLISLLSFIWLYLETKDIEKLKSLSISTFWFVIPTLPMFLLFPYLLQQGLSFWASLGLSLIFMLLCLALTMFILNKLGISP
jgi:uncharacterized membrane protein (GlpM family)